ncbi:hypothetical protein [Chryseobacterium defluvii]|uniref:hypothetical protein n=1 Tax=Chryseobacterium defluvii TaxID=160396 RepID=UPI001E4C4D37|nr:hypothetical protein [Chryseobacterium defluvii]
MNVFITFSLLPMAFLKGQQPDKYLEKEVDYLPYYQEMYKADSLKMIGKEKESFDKLDDLFKIYKPRNTMFYYEMKTYIVLGEKLGVKRDYRPYLNDLIMLWGYNSSTIGTDDILKKVYAENGFNDQKIKETEQFHKNNLKQEYIDGINKIRSLDQSPKRMEAEKEVNAENFEIYAKYGYPTVQNIHMGSKVFLIPLFIHFNKNEQQYEIIYKILYENVKKGAAEPIEMKNFLALKNIENTRSYYFGDDGTSLYVDKLQDDVPYDTVKKRRKMYGLPSLELEKWKSKIESENSEIE